MAYLIEWQVKAAIMVALMVIVFALFLSKDALFNRNRIWLLSTLFVPWIIPLLAMPLSVKSILFAPEAELDLTTLSIPVTVNTNTVAPATSAVDWSHILLSIYLLISMVFVVRLLWGYTYLIKLKGKSTKLKVNGVNLYLLDDKEINPFSFFQSVFVPQTVMEQEDKDHILNHERAHCRQWHSVDITLAEWMLVLQWWNPFAWWLRKLIAQNHEFCVDKAMMQISEEPKQYQYSLMHYLPGSKSLNLVNNFSQSLIKKRIIMMNNKTDRKLLAKLKSLLVIIVTFTALVAFTNPEKTKVQVKKADKIETIKSDVDLRKFIAQNIKYPFEAQNNNFAADVMVNVPINKKGKAGRPKIGSAKGSNVVNPGEVVVVAYASEGEGTADDSSTSMTALEDEVKRVMTELPAISDVNLMNTTLELNVKFVLQQKESNESKPAAQELVVVGSGKMTDNPLEIATGKASGGNPIYILDGKEVSNNGLATIKKSHIKEVSVLKDEAAIEQYGERAKDGVIIITTKGTEQSSQAEVKVSSGKMTDNPLKIATGKASGGNPIYIVNGKEISNKEFNAIKKNKIESVSVLKDEAAIEQYGERAKDGVIMIETKDHDSDDISVVEFIQNVGVWGQDKPLILVDGKEFNGKVDEDNIKSIKVVKGPDAIAQYGDKARNGIIAVYTKK
nr:M56 family metallopeptidase [uncultured Carboxylicivirga sp.]